MSDVAGFISVEAGMSRRTKPAGLPHSASPTHDVDFSVIAIQVDVPRLQELAERYPGTVAEDLQDAWAQESLEYLRSLGDYSMLLERAAKLSRRDPRVAEVLDRGLRQHPEVVRSAIEKAKQISRFAAETIAEKTIDAYKCGEFCGPFEPVEFVRRLTLVLSPPDSDRLTGVVIDAVISGIIPPKRKGPNGIPAWIKGIAVEYAMLQNKTQGLRIGGEYSEACQASADLLHGFGLPVTHASVRKWYAQGLRYEGPRWVWDEAVPRPLPPKRKMR